jgi:RHS repeat-associated protein
MVENNQYYFYHNDHLGTPQELTDINGSVVWSATYTAFGEATVDPSSTVTNNLRFPGQYYDAETGKHYNLHRYYDPKAGRYISEDPIGFEGGDVNLYRYVNNSPQVWMDPWGLYSWGEFMEDWATVADIRAAQQYWQNYGGPVGSVMSGLLSFSGLATVQESGETLGDPCKSTGQKLWAGAKIVGVGASWYLGGSTRVSGVITGQARTSRIIGLYNKFGKRFYTDKTGHFFALDSKYHRLHIGPWSTWYKR